MAGTDSISTDATEDDTSPLGRLSELDDYQVAEGYPDVRGWDVQGADGRRVGTIGDLIVDTQALRVRYLDVEIDRTADDDARHTLIPIDGVQLDAKGDHATLDGYTAAQVAALPRYDGGAITRAYEDSLQTGHRARGDAVAAAAVAAAVAPDTVRDTARDTARDVDGSADTTRRITLAEERLAVGKRDVSAGEVELRKTVDTRHVQERVDLTHEEVSIERRPVTDASPLGTEPLGEGEIRVPVMEERLVVEKRLVPVEEIIVRKRQVTDTQTVHGDVRRERLDVDDAAARAAGLARDATPPGTR